MEQPLPEDIFPDPDLDADNQRIDAENAAQLQPDPTEPGEAEDAALDDAGPGQEEDQQSLDSGAADETAQDGELPPEPDIEAEESSPVPVEGGSDDGGGDWTDREKALIDHILSMIAAG